MRNIWQYIEENDVPYDKARYMKVDGDGLSDPGKGITLTMSMHVLHAWIVSQGETCSLSKAWI